MDDEGLLMNRNFACCFFTALRRYLAPYLRAYLPRYRVTSFSADASTVVGVLVTFTSFLSVNMGKKEKELSQAEVWDDSALLQSWDDAVTEYKVTPLSNYALFLAKTLYSSITVYTREVSVSRMRLKRTELR